MYIPLPIQVMLIVYFSDYGILLSVSIQRMAKYSFLSHVQNMFYGLKEE